MCWYIQLDGTHKWKSSAYISKTKNKPNEKLSTDLEGTQISELAKESGVCKQKTDVCMICCSHDEQLTHTQNHTYSHTQRRKWGHGVCKQASKLWVRDLLLTLWITHILTQPHTDIHTHTPTQWQSHYHSHTLTSALTHSHSDSHTITITHWQSKNHTHTHEERPRWVARAKTHVWVMCWSHTHNHTLTQPHSHTQTHSHTKKKVSRKRRVGDVLLSLWMRGRLRCEGCRLRRGEVHSKQGGKVDTAEKGLHHRVYTEQRWFLLDVVL